MLKVFKKDFACNGTLVEDEELGTVIQLQGDQRTKVSTLLTDEGGIDKKQIKIHGF
jgi:translation initiation factor 1